MVAEKIAVVRKKADKNVFRFRTRLDRVQNSADTMIQITDLTVIAGLYDSRQRRIDCICPDGISHERNFVVEMILLDSAKNEVRHSIRVVHPIERNRRGERRMRADK